MISTRGRYALRVLTDLALQGEGYTPMRQVARRQGISLKYLEQIIPVLVRGGYLQGASGKGGGYRLCRPAKDCRVGDILRLTEGSLAPVACLAPGATQCDRRGSCPTYPLWNGLQQVVEQYLNSVTLADLAAGQQPDNQ